MTQTITKTEKSFAERPTPHCSIKWRGLRHYALALRKTALMIEVVRGGGRVVEIVFNQPRGFR